MSFAQASKTIEIKPVMNDKPGRYTIQVDLKDSLGASSTYTFEIKVNQVEKLI